MEQTIETDRLILRPWRDSDAPALYRYASDPLVGDPAGWPAHTSVEFSLAVIREVFSSPEVYTVVLKSTDEPVGCCGLVPAGARPCEAIGPDDAEIGYWVGRPFWGQGITPEAVDALAARATGTLGLKRLWIAFTDGNDKSRRVAEKCGFTYHHTQDSEHYYVR